METPEVLPNCFPRPDRQDERAGEKTRGGDKSSKCREEPRLFRVNVEMTGEGEIEGGFGSRESIALGVVATSRDRESAPKCNLHGATSSAATLP
jgi:hypothetical protein